MGNISETIKMKVKEECNTPRYKVVVQVTTGELKDQGVRVASRSLWDTATDNYSSSSFQNVSSPTRSPHFCACMPEQSCSPPSVYPANSKAFGAVQWCLGCTSNRLA